APLITPASDAAVALIGPGGTLAVNRLVDKPAAHKTLVMRSTLCRARCGANGNSSNANSAMLGNRSLAFLHSARATTRSNATGKSGRRELNGSWASSSTFADNSGTEFAMNGKLP